VVDEDAERHYNKNKLASNVTFLAVKNTSKKIKKVVD
jgi:hypothetical protein